MSEQLFKEAKSQLAMSQGLRDRLMKQQMAQQGQEMPMEKMPMEEPMDEVAQSNPPFEGAETPQEEQMEQKGIIQAVTDAVKPMIDEVKALFTKKDEPQEVEIKIDGEMTSKKDDDEQDTAVGK